MVEGARQTAVFPGVEAKVAVGHIVEVSHLQEAQKFVMNTDCHCTRANFG
jgi:hypothetical protein